MLQRTVSFKTLLRIVGVFFLLYGFYVIVLVLTSQFEALTDEINYLLCGGWFMGNSTLPGNLYLFGPFMPGPLFWVGIGVLFWGVTSGRVWVAYVCLQLALWLISLSVWFPFAILIGTTSYSPGVFTPFALVTLVLSLALLACYKPVACFLHKLVGSKNITPVA
ncbi:hypothetical protein [Ktedonobacter robiniae]|uniref:Uncharacterized protein n=1 Tax=Ktedonobacter robiniae TaxID=2778365 RepID=A0ABQ3UTJ7_9CHLR|nr:hypothetical protein [Ktedonobacter robiniae]GHO56011.1 hypothetical protein KSB_44860 [Ktedonobacter robiniae]